MLTYQLQAGHVESKLSFENYNGAVLLGAILVSGSPKMLVERGLATAELELHAGVGDRDVVRQAVALYFTCGEGIILVLAGVGIAGGENGASLTLIWSPQPKSRREMEASCSMRLYLRSANGSLSNHRVRTGTPRDSSPSRISWKLAASSLTTDRI
ncbi:hypothetical protein C8J57DRAFT_1395415 [Mycena rebaudengoi]|nr:hypothetical protein C8J57DRAFT_1395415 [Mycena rebaudengoi]